MHGQAGHAHLILTNELQDQCYIVGRHDPVSEALKFSISDVDQAGCGLQTNQTAHRDA